MAKKETTVNKTDTKAKASKKVATPKKTEVVETPIDVMNGDPAVITDNAEEEVTKAEEIVEVKAEEEAPKTEQIIKPEIADKATMKEEIKEEEPKKKENKITKNINRTFGYIWNGQMIDF